MLYKTFALHTKPHYPSPMEVARSAIFLTDCAWYKVKTFRFLGASVGGIGGERAKLAVEEFHFVKFFVSKPFAACVDAFPPTGVFLDTFLSLQTKKYQSLAAWRSDTIIPSKFPLCGKFTYQNERRKIISWVVPQVG